MMITIVSINFISNYEKKIKPNILFVVYDCFISIMFWHKSILQKILHVPIKKSNWLIN